MYLFDMALLVVDFNCLYGKNNECFVKELAVADCQMNLVSSFLFKSPELETISTFRNGNSNMAIIGTTDIYSFQILKIYWKRICLRQFQFNVVEHGKRILLVAF
jgi:hypothetical protein